jgi:hypothetical protein
LMLGKRATGRWRNNRVRDFQIRQQLSDTVTRRPRM